MYFLFLCNIYVLKKIMDKKIKIKIIIITKRKYKSY